MTRALVLSLVVPLAVAGPPASNPFVFFEPGLVLTGAERRVLARDEPIVRVLASTGTDVGTFAAVRTRIDPDRLIAWVRRIEQLKQGPHVRAVRRFSGSPQASDLDAFALDADELDDLRACRPGACGLKLTADEMAELRRVADAAESVGDEWRPAAQRAFREAMAARVRMYLNGGHAALPPTVDHAVPSVPGQRVAALEQRVGFLVGGWPAFAAQAIRHPRPAVSDSESFVYWSEESLRGRPLLSATHVTLARSEDGIRPAVAVAGMQIFSTHYTDASIGVTMLMRGADGWNYLVYVNHSDVDVLAGRFGRLVRRGVQRRLPGEARDVLKALRQRLESGPPAADAG